MSYRVSGIPVGQVLDLFARNQTPSQFKILTDHLHHLGHEIERLK